MPRKYHLALENSAGADTWTEKLADPYLCWAFPFYAGCTNLEDYLPSGSFMYLDLAKPEQTIDHILNAVQNNRWGKSKPALEMARKHILTKYNLAWLLVRLAKSSMDKPFAKTTGQKRYIWSERSLWPEKDACGNMLEWAARNALMMFDKNIELKTVGIKKRLEVARNKKRNRQISNAEKHE